MPSRICKTALAFVLVAALALGAAAAPRPKRQPREAPDSFSIALQEVVIRPKKEKYSKRNNPAVDFMQRIRQSADSLNPRRHANYNYDTYERITLAINNFQAVDPDGDTTRLLRTLPALREALDTSVVTGEPILNIALREKAYHTSFRAEPRAERRYVTGLRDSGIDEMIDPQAMRTFYEDVLREVDVFSNDITLLQNRFVSPLGRLGPDFYKYYLADTVAVGPDTCVVLAFVPRNSASFGFTGKMYVPRGDSTMFVKRIELRVPSNINLNFVNTLQIDQEFERAADGSALKVLDDMVVTARIVPGTPSLYGRRVTAHRGHNFEPAPDPSVFEYLGHEIVSPGAYARDPAFWDSRRYIEIAQGENSVADMMARLRSVKAFYWTEKVLSALVTGYISPCANAKWDYGPVNTTLSGNTIEGLRIRVGGMTTARLSPRWFSRHYVAWGTHDHRWKYSVELEHSFVDKRRHSREFPMHALRLVHSYDVDMLGQHYLFTNPDNVFLSLKRAPSVMATYRRLTSLRYLREWPNNFSINIEARHERQNQSRYVNFWTGQGVFLNHYNMSTLEVTLRFAPGEKFFQTRSERLPVNLDAPVFMVSHRWGPRGWLGNRWGLSVTEASFQKRWWLSAFGYIDVIARGGHVWTQSPFINLLIPNANLSYTIQPESFVLMSALEFINDSYASLDFTYWANGALFNLIPGLKRLKLREALSFRGLWGHLSDRNNPELDPTLLRFPLNAVTRPMTNTPYMEIGVGVDNILSVLRLDYVWRLTYRDTPYCSKSGLRLALHFTF